MSKRRTRKEKERALHSFNVTLDEATFKYRYELGVNRQSNSSEAVVSPNSKSKKVAEYLAKDRNLAEIKLDIYKTLILAGFIVGSELVLYFIWH